MATKFRPYLTQDDLEIILASLKSTGSSPILIHYLSGFQTKTELGLTSPALVTKPTISDRLGLSPEPALSLSQLKEQSYQKWKANSSKCSAQEIARAMMYRYENDLMSPIEEAEYEAKIDRGY